MSEPLDVIVIGAGPGGYIAAIRAAQLGLRTACIDDFKDKSGKAVLGGTCLNVGCIPSKALLQSSEHFFALSHEFADHGIQVTGKPKIDVKQMMARKETIVAKLTAGINFLFKKNHILNVHGHARLCGREGEHWKIEVQGGTKPSQLIAKHIIIATGSQPRALPQIGIDNVSILDNEGALALTSVPKRLGVIGAGVIGLEMGSVWKRLGADVTILEASPTFLAAADQQLAKLAFKTLTKDTGLNLVMGVEINEVALNKSGPTVHYHKEGKAHTLAVDKLIVAVGRVPNTEGLGADVVGLQTDERGFIVVDELCHTNLPNIWAVGDVVRGPMLAHKASEEGVAVAERIAGQKPHIDFNSVPWVIYTSPEIAWVGKTEEQLKAAGQPYKVGVSNFMSNGRALGLGHTYGMVKVLADVQTDRVLGVHIIGPMASELIMEGVLALEFKASSEDIARIVHAHPSLTEVMHEAALACDQRALHG